MNGWKVFAIVLLILFILETVGVFWIASVGLNLMNKEKECQINVCADYDSFYFDDIESTCYCYRNNEMVLQQYLK